MDENTGTARRLIAWVALALTVLCVVLAVIAGRANGLLVLASLFLFAGIWAIGALRSTWWVADPAISHRLDTLDAELDFIESVQADLATLTRKD